MRLFDALRVKDDSCIAFVGAGGKSSAIFQLAKECALPVIISASTHMAEEQVRIFYKHFVIDDCAQLKRVLDNPPGETIILTGGLAEDNRTHGLSFDLLEVILKYCKHYGVPFLIEADGSRKLPLKAPANHEPAIPPWVDLVVVTAGLDSLDQPIDYEHVHRPEIITRLTGAKMGDLVNEEIISKLLGNLQAGLKNIPDSADRKVLLNQVKSASQITAADQIAELILENYSSVLFANIPHWDKLVKIGYPANPVIRRREKIAGIILAGGRAERFGSPKILLDWGGVPIIRNIILNAIKSGLSPVILVLGAYVKEVIPVVQDLPVKIITNKIWEKGQSTSLKAGINALPDGLGGFMILLGDQPQVPGIVMRDLVKVHQANTAPIILPVVGGKRANPVLYDIAMRNDLNKIDGDTGGRALFNRFPVYEFPCAESGLTEDIDTVEDYYQMRKKYLE